MICNGDLGMAASNEDRRSRLIAVATGAALVSSFQIYNQAVVNNLIPACKMWLKDDNAFDWYWSLVVASYSFGKFLGTFVSGQLADRLGRVNALTIDSCLLAIGGMATLLSGGFHSVWMLIFGRMVIGVAAGVGWIVSSMFIAEISTTERRGTMFSVLSIAFGVGVSCGTALSLPNVMGTEEYWPVAMALGALLGAPVFIVLHFVIPESPRHLILRRNMVNDGIMSVLFYQGEEHVSSTIVDLLSERESSAKMSGLRRRGVAFWRALYISCLLMAANVLVGVTVFISYSTSILQAAEFTHTTASYWSVFLSTLEIVSVVPMTVFVDAYGRRPLIIYGYGFSAAMTFLLTVFVRLHSSEFRQIAVLVTLALAWASTALPCAAGACVITELFPQTTRTDGMVASRSFMWLFNSIMIALFLPMYRSFGALWATSPFFIGTFVVVIVLYYILPETKRRTFVEISEELAGSESRSLLGDAPAQTTRLSCSPLADVHRPFQEFATKF